MKTLSALLLAILLITSQFKALAQSKPTTIRVDFSKDKGIAKPIWAWFGYDEPNYTYMKDGRKLLSELAQANRVPVYVRAHSLLVTGDGEAALKWGSTNAYTEDKDGNPVYDWTIIDKIFDTYVERGMRPMAQKVCPRRAFWCSTTASTSSTATPTRSGKRWDHPKSPRRNRLSRSKPPGNCKCSLRPNG